MSSTLFDKIWTTHVVTDRGDESLLYVDRVLLQENSFHAFDKIRREGRTVRNPNQAFAFSDHYVPTRNRELGINGIRDPEIRNMVELITSDTETYGIELFGLGHDYQGILHVVGPEFGITQPGLVIAGADSHTSTHGALGAYAFGIGSSEVAHVLATQTLWRSKPKTLRVTISGERQVGVSSKDLILFLIKTIGSGGAVGYAIEYCGDTIYELSVEARMTVCNMSIEAGARAGMIAPDQKTFEYVQGREKAPSGQEWDDAVAYWKTLFTDDDAEFDAVVDIDASTLTPFVTWGTNPGQGLPLSASVPSPDDATDDVDRVAIERALEYMDLTPGTPLRDVAVDTVFIGSCTNGRIEDLRVAADILRGRKVKDGMRLMVVPGSARVRLQAESEGLDQVFLEAGGEWRGAGCSMCLGMNPDKLTPGERSASTSNRNFEGRQGPGGRTHLVSPAVAASTAVTGHLSSPADLT